MQFSLISLPPSLSLYCIDEFNANRALAIIQWDRGFRILLYTPMGKNVQTIIFITEAIILVNDTLEQSEYDGYRFQVLPFLSSPIELFSIEAELAVGHGSVCALAFFNGDMNLIAVSAPIR
jgi:hypothetical protein